MKSVTIAGVLIALATGTFGVAWLRWKRTLPAGVSDRVSVAALRQQMSVATDSALEEAESLTAANNPFRLSNTPASVRYDPSADMGTGAPGMPVIPPLRPMLVLKAIVGGPPWQAVIDGIPGQPAGTIAMQGSRFDKLTVRSVSRDSVIVQGPDTAWVLSFRGRE